MSEDEKAKQIGLIVTEYHKAKVELAHLKQKLKRIGEAYNEVGRSLSEESYRGLKIENSHLQVLYSPSKEKLSEVLLDEQSLLSVIVERDAAQKRVNELHEQLKALGLANLQ